MNCSEIKTQLHEFVDGELDGDRKEVVKEHLSGCTECRREYEELQKLDRLTELSFRKRYSPGKVAGAVMEEISDREPEADEGDSDGTDRATPGRSLIAASVLLFVVLAGSLVIHFIQYRMNRTLKEQLAEAKSSDKIPSETTDENKDPGRGKTRKLKEPSPSSVGNDAFRERREGGEFVQPGNVPYEDLPINKDRKEFVESEKEGTDKGGDEEGDTDPAAEKSESNFERVPVDGWDRYGDPLPKGGRLRLGTRRFRTPGGTRRFVLDRRKNRVIASTGWGKGGIIIWDQFTGKIIKQFKVEGLQAGLRSIALSPDGQTLAISSEKRKKKKDEKDHSRIFLIDLDRETVVRKWKSHVGPTSELVYSADGTRLVTTGQKQRGMSLTGKNRMFKVSEPEKPVRVWNPETGKEIASYDMEEKSPNAVAITSDGNLVAVEGPERSIHLWNPEKNRRKATFKGHAGSVTTLDFSEDGKVLAAGSSDSTISLWNVEEEEQIGSFIGHEGSLDDVSFAPGSRMLVSSGGDDGKAEVKVWSTKRREQLQSISIPEYRRGISQVEFIGNGSSILTTGSGGAIRVWDVSSGREVSPRVGHNASVHSVAYSYDGSYILTASSDDTVKIWRSADGELLQTLKIDKGDGPDRYKRDLRSMMVSEDHSTLALGLRTDVELWNLEKGYQIETNFEKSPRAKYLAISADGSRIASLASGTISVFDTNTGEVISETDAPVFEKYRRTDVKSISFRNRGTELVVGAYKGFRVYDVKNMEGKKERLVAKEIEDEEERVWTQELEICRETGWTALALSTDPKPTIQIWRGGDRKPIREILLQKDVSVESLSFSPGGFLLAAGTSKGKLFLYNVLTGNKLATVEQFGEVNALTFSPDGRELVSGSDTGNALVWSVSAAIADDRLTRTDREQLWKRFLNKEGRPSAAAVLELVNRDAGRFLNKQLDQLLEKHPDQDPEVLLDKLRMKNRRKRKNAANKLRDLAVRYTPVMRQVLRRRNSEDNPEAKKQLTNVRNHANQPFEVKENREKVLLLVQLLSLHTTEVARNLITSIARSTEGMLEQEIATRKLDRGFSGEDEKDGEKNRPDQKSSQVLKHTSPGSPEDFVGETLEDLTLFEYGNNRKISIGDYQGKVVLLNVWRSWCGPCREGVKHLRKLQNNTRQEDLVILGVSNEPEKDVTSFLEKRGINYPILRENTASRTDLFDAVSGVPTTFIIGPDGVVKEVFTGPRSQFLLKKKYREYRKKRH